MLKTEFLTVLVPLAKEQAAPTVEWAGPKAGRIEVKIAWPGGKAETVSLDLTWQSPAGAEAGKGPAVFSAE